MYQTKHSDKGWDVALLNFSRELTLTLNLPLRQVDRDESVMTIKKTQIQKIQHDFSDVTSIA